MKTVKIYGEVYEVSPLTNELPDFYWYRGTFHEEPLERMSPNGYVYYSDGSIVAVYNNSAPVKIIGGIVAAAVLIVAGVLIFNHFRAPKTVAYDGAMIKTIQDKDSIINFNGIPQCNGKDLDIRFTNGNKPAVISVTGDGVASSTVELQPNASLQTIPVKFNTDSSVVDAVLHVSVDGNNYDYPIIIENPSIQTISGDNYYISNTDHPFEGELFITE